MVLDVTKFLHHISLRYVLLLCGVTLFALYLYEVRHSTQSVSKQAEVSAADSNLNFGAKSTGINIKVSESLDKTSRSKPEDEERKPENEMKNQSLNKEIRDKLREINEFVKMSEENGAMEEKVKKLAEEKVMEPSTEYEKLRRLLKRNTRDQWFYMSSELKKLLKGNATRNSSSDIGNVLLLVNERQRALISQLEELQKSDGFETWREKEAAELSDLVQKRLHYLQNPKNCSSVRKLICTLDKKGCGFGCMLHRTVNCLMVAYRTQRTLIWKSKKWRYHKDGWEAVYLPLSDTCVDKNRTSTPWPGKNDTQVLDFTFTPMMTPTSAYTPLSIPEDLAPRLKKLHGHPFVWWVGQMLKYILRPQASTSKLLEETKKKIGFERPIVGVQIRRTDKKSEAKFYPVEDYMNAVEEYYNVLELTQKVPVRRIYLATDEPQVFSEVKKKYPQYKILGDLSIVKSTSNRYSETSLMGLIIDVHFLSLSDYLVCTLSSNFGRLAYELMQTYHPDAADRVHSLDFIYVFHLQREAHNHVAVYSHKSRNRGEISLEVGDIIDVQTNYWNGYSRGRNSHSKITGLFPSFKVVQKIEAEKFPTYPEVSET